MTAGIVVDVAGRRVGLTRLEVVRLRDAAAAEAGTSSAARDLALVFDRALTAPQAPALRRGELLTLARIAVEAGMVELASRLRDS